MQVYKNTKIRNRVTRDTQSGHTERKIGGRERESKYEHTELSGGELVEL